MKTPHDSLLRIAPVVWCIMIPLVIWAQEGAVKDSHVLPSGFAMKFERMGGYAGTYSVYWIYPDGQVINALGETAKIPSDILEQWLNTKPSESPRLAGTLNEFSAIGPLCFDCITYSITIYDKDRTRAFLFSVGEVEKTFPGIITRLRRLAWSPLMGPPVEAQDLLLRRQPIRLGGNLLQSKLIYKVEPIYPEQAKSAQLSGKVVLLVTVDPEGVPVDVEVVSGDPILADSAVTAAKQWRYSPTLLNGEPVPVTGTVTVIFSLTGSGGMVEYTGGLVEPGKNSSGRE